MYIYHRTPARGTPSRKRGGGYTYEHVVDYVRHVVEHAFFDHGVASAGERAVDHGVAGAGGEHVVEHVVD